MSAPTYRPATDHDREWVWATKQQCLGSYVRQTFGEWDEAAQTARFHANFDASEIQIIRLDGKDVGYVAVDYGESEIRLFNIMVLPTHQNQRLGTNVMLSLLAAAREKQIPLSLQVLKVNPARTLYERLGFAVMGETPTHYQMRWSP
ncbi:MAG: GNAT family N-acetyltransferase [Cephaloticoccus sp.]|nr:GNAT family N-acetyltransferase [Cephaloticoccus sp.]